MQTNNSYAIKMDQKTEKVVGTSGEKDRPSSTSCDLHEWFDLTRIHSGTYAAKPFATYLIRRDRKFGKPFDKLADVAFDSPANDYFADGCSILRLRCTQIVLKKMHCKNTARMCGVFSLISI